MKQFEWHIPLELEWVFEVVEAVVEETGCFSDSSQISSQWTANVMTAANQPAAAWLLEPE
jgi:hypothetical protein